MTKPHYTIAVGGIDTDVGKSYVTGLLARYLIQQNQRVTTLKLVQTGCRETSDDIQAAPQIDGAAADRF